MAGSWQGSPGRFWPSIAPLEANRGWKTVAVSTELRPFVKEGRLLANGETGSHPFSRSGSDPAFTEKACASSLGKSVYCSGTFLHIVNENLIFLQKNLNTYSICGHLTTAWTAFTLNVDKNRHYLDPPSCPGSYWMPPSDCIEQQKIHHS